MGRKSIVDALKKQDACSRAARNLSTLKTSIELRHVSKWTPGDASFIQAQKTQVDAKKSQDIASAACQDMVDASNEGRQLLTDE